jgi:hypothetical protein
MAINQESIGLDIASRAVVAAGNLSDALSELNGLLAWATGANISVLDQFNAAFEASGELRHVSGATLEKLVGVVAPALQTYLEATSSGGETYRQIIDRSRRR